MTRKYTEITAEHKKQLAQELKAAYDLIEAAITLIRQHEDGPLTMRFALRDIENQIEEVQYIAERMLAVNEEMRVVMAVMGRQRDEALKQRDAREIIDKLRRRQQKDNDSVG